VLALVHEVEIALQGLRLPRDARRHALAPEPVVVVQESQIVDARLDLLREVVHGGQRGMRGEHVGALLQAQPRVRQSVVQGVAANAVAANEQVRRVQAGRARARVAVHRGPGGHAVPQAAT